MTSVGVLLSAISHQYSKLPLFQFSGYTRAHALRTGATRRPIANPVASLRGATATSYLFARIAINGITARILCTVLSQPCKNQRTGRRVSSQTDIGIGCQS